jgi:FAD/FMN-containing dehydrogenase
VVLALDYARDQDVEISVRSGGHGVSGRSANDGGIVIDLSRMNSVEVLDAESGRVRVEPGARWGDVARVLTRHGLAMSSGDYGDVGVGCLATAGGIGFLSRKYGLTIDHVTAAEIVVADGRRFRVDADHHPDLFWALRGAGGNFGIVTAFALDAYKLENVAYATLTMDATRTADFAAQQATLTPLPRGRPGPRPAGPVGAVPRDRRAGPEQAHRPGPGGHPQRHAEAHHSGGRRGHRGDDQVR